MKYLIRYYVLREGLREVEASDRVEAEIQFGRVPEKTLHDDATVEVKGSAAIQDVQEKP